jgi:hypothetical protein
MTKTPIGLQELRRRIYRKAKSSVGWRRWSNEYLYDVLGLYWGLENPAAAWCWGGEVKVAVGRQDS